MPDPILDQLKKRVAALQETVRQREVEIVARRNEAAQANAQVKTLNERVAELVRTSQTLQDQLDKATQRRPKVKVQDLFSQFRQHLVDVNQQPPAKGQPRVVVEGLEVEVKGGLDVSAGIAIVPAAVTPETVSTVRFTLRPAPSVRVDEGA